MILDSNIIIYSVMPDSFKIRDFLKNAESELHVSAISKIEVLGYHKLTTEEKLLFESFFNSISIIQVTNAVIDRAIEIRQKRNVSLGDSIIAASALVNHKKIFTNNEDDFYGISGIEIITMKSILSS